eukprot:CAMPEP_0204257674 /NCGR_PEP_ID=MMETSP0468-20130131/4581_1 /ASSEMBLY_ACC=CAM_ASM_000383 /TAXON_ID=2969 /ORGANISM="Oxyrrhis marina" /LENGTH=132 /DNA_ID=CAMNT_0051231825 /DNA_START=159 /DNA_END=557 /DNA_ORIENTATION=+
MQQRQFPFCPSEDSAPPVNAALGSDNTGPSAGGAGTAPCGELLVVRDPAGTSMLVTGCSQRGHVVFNPSQNRPAHATQMHVHPQLLTLQTASRCPQLRHWGNWRTGACEAEPRDRRGSRAFQDAALQTRPNL